MSGWEPREIALLNQARTALDAARTVDEVKTIRDKAEAVRLYAKAQGECLTIQNYAAEVKIRAERRAGELLAGMELKPGRPKTNPSIVEGLSSLKDVGISEKQSHRWQAVATVPSQAFEDHIEEVKSADKELTTAGGLTSAKLPTSQASVNTRAQCAKAAGVGERTYDAGKEILKAAAEGAPR